MLYLHMPYHFTSRLVVLLICFCSVQKYCTIDTVLIYYMLILRLLDGLPMCKGVSLVFECKSNIYDSLVTKIHIYDCEHCLQCFLCMCDLTCQLFWNEK